MKITTKLACRARNIGKPTESYNAEPMPYMDAMKALIKWMATQEMGRRFDVMFGRSLSEIDMIDQDPRVRNKVNAMTQSLDDLFDLSDFDDAEMVIHEDDVADASGT